MKNRDQSARNDIKNKYLNEGLERIKNNESVLEKNEKSLNRLNFIVRQLDIQLRMENAKLSGLEVLRPTFEFEKSATWRELNKELIELGIEQMTAQLKEAKESVESLTVQNERCYLEIEAMRKKMDRLDDSIMEGEEVVEIGGNEPPTAG
jgi:phage shock protein A